MHRAVVGIAKGEGVGQGPLEPQLGLRVIAHGLVLLVGGPVLHAPVIPRGLSIGPGMRRAADPLGVARCLIQVIGHDDPRAVPLPEDVTLEAAGQREGKTVPKRNGEAVPEAPDPCHGAEILVEGPVFLHQDHDMPYVQDRPRGVVRGNRQSAPDRFRKHRGGTGKRRRGFQELPPVCVGHRKRPLNLGPAWRRGQRCRPCPSPSGRPDGANSSRPRRP